RRHTRFSRDWSSDVCSSDLGYAGYNAWDPLSFTKRPKGRGSGYLNIAYSKEVVPHLTLKAAIGYTRMSSDIRAAGYRNYVDYNEIGRASCRERVEQTGGRVA